MICKSRSIAWTSLSLALSFSAAMAEGDSAKAAAKTAAPAVTATAAPTPAAASAASPAATAAAPTTGKAKGRSCDEVQAEIQAKLEKKGVKNFTLAAVTPDAVAGGKVIGSCEGGAKRILYARK